MPAYLPKCSMLSIASLLALAAACGWCQPSFADAQADRVATALLRVHQSEPAVLEVVRQEGSQPPTLEEWWTFRNTMAQLVESPFVVESALRKQDVAEIPAIKSAEDPIPWVRQRVEVDFPGNGEIMRVRLADGGLSDAELENVLNSIVESFISEVVDGERIEKMRMKNTLQQQLDRSSNELNVRRQEYFELAEQLGGMDAPGGKVRAELLLEQWRANREDRRALQNRLAEAYIELQIQLIDLGALKLREDDPDTREDDADQDDARSASAMPNLVEVEVDDATREQVNRARAKRHVISSILQARIQQLDQDTEVITEKIERVSAQNAELVQRREELERKAELVDQMGQKLALWDVELAAGPRVEVLQPARIEPMDGNQQP